MLYVLLNLIGVENVLTAWNVFCFTLARMSAQAIPSRPT